MKTNLVSAFRTAALAATLLALSASVSANETTDRAGQLLALHGSVPVKNAGPYVETGTFLIQVAVKLGQPSAKLADGTWLYQNYAVENSDAHGTLIVRFHHGQVSELALVTPAIATAMCAPKKANDKILVAQQR